MDRLKVSPTDRDYTISLSAKFPTTVVDMNHRLDSGTTVATLKIDGVVIGGLEDIAVSSTEGTEGATGANDIAIGQELVLSLTGETGPADILAISIKTARVE